MYGAIVPDDKDWTWVLERPCPECGFDASSLDPTLVAGLVRENAARWQVALQDPVETLRRRVSDDRWSTLEYAAHVRDVYRRYLARLILILEVDDPLFENWDQDVTAVEERYNEQDPATVSHDLVDSAEHIAAAFEGVAGELWERTGRRSDGAAFTIDSFARYMVHDPIHHLWDVDQHR